MKEFKGGDLADLVRYLRERDELTPTQLAARLGCAQSHVWGIEHRVRADKQRNKWVPSEAHLRKMAEVCARSEEEKAELIRRLLLARAREVMGEEIRGYFSDSVLLGMPQVFLDRLQADLALRTPEELAHIESACGLTGRITLVLRRLGHVSPFEVAQLAAALGQSVDQYLLLADYMTDSLKQLLTDYPGCVSLLEFLGQLSPATRRELEAFRSKLGSVAGMTMAGQ